MKGQIILSAILMLRVCSAFGQVIPPGGGLLVFKDQHYLPDSMARAMIFSSSIDHGAGSGGSTVFVGAAGGRAVVQENGVLGVFMAEEINIRNVAPGESVNRCMATIDRLRELSHLNQSVAESLSPILDLLQRDVAAVEAGKMMINGEWKDQEHAVTTQATPQATRREIKQLRISSLTTTEGDTYRNATYKSSDETKVAFSHADGAARISWELLKAGDQLAWGYDAEKVKAERLAKKKAEEEKIAAELLAKKQAEEAKGKADAEAKAAAEKAEKEKREQLAAQEAARQKLAATLEEIARKRNEETNNTTIRPSSPQSKYSLGTDQVAGFNTSGPYTARSAVVINVADKCHAEKSRVARLMSFHASVLQSIGVPLSLARSIVCDSATKDAVSLWQRSQQSGDPEFSDIYEDISLAINGNVDYLLSNAMRTSMAIASFIDGMSEQDKDEKHIGNRTIRKYYIELDEANKSANIDAIDRLNKEGVERFNADCLSFYMPKYKITNIEEYIQLTKSGLAILAKQSSP